MFEKLHRDRSKLKQTDNIRLYLFVILKNSIINALKHEQVRSRYVERELENTSIEEDTIENMLEAQEEEAIIQQKVNQIFNLFTPRQKEIMYFRYVEEMDIKDIAQLMEMNYQSVQNLIQRSIKRARDYFNT
jgi:RNA polymerase sigma factor (sigma-70 family)